MNNYCKYLTSKGYAKSSVKAYYSNLLDFLNFCEYELKIEPESTSHNHLIQYIEHLKQRSVTQRTIQHHLQALNHFFLWQATLDENTYNPAVSIKLQVPHGKHTYRLLDRQQLDALHHHYKIDSEDHLQLRDKVIIGLLVFQGLDGGNLRRITGQDIKLREGTIHIAGSKSSNARTIRLEPQQLFDLMDYLRTHQKEDAETPVFSVYTSLLKTLVAKLQTINPKVDDIRQLRASVITCWIRQHGLREAQYRAGHRYISSTEAYLQNDITDLQLDIDRIHPLE